MRGSVPRGELYLRVIFPLDLSVPTVMCDRFSPVSDFCYSLMVPQENLSSSK